jgi:hypothetical protein
MNATDGSSEVSAAAMVMTTCASSGPTGALFEVLRSGAAAAAISRLASRP